MSNGRGGRCVFCGAAGLSKEDIWPRWIRKASPHQLTEISSQMITHTHFADDESAAFVVPTITERQGDTTSRKVRKVCRTHCNGGWMSRLETAVKPLLLPLMKDSSNVTLTAAEQAVVARWAVKTSIMMQYTDLSTKTSNPTDDIEFYEAGEPLGMNQVWLGRYEGDQWLRRFSHATFDVIDKASRTWMDRWGTTTIVVDSLVLLVLWDKPGYVTAAFPYASDMVRVWPTEPTAQWPPPTTFSDDSLRTAAAWVHGAGIEAVNALRTET